MRDFSATLLTVGRPCYHIRSFRTMNFFKCLSLSKILQRPKILPERKLRFPRFRYFFLTIIMDG
ncbi:MAG: hypothetical protein CMH76_06110 [Nitrospinae bacterium]|nr:hypothetical protein [Nitrospinota bacterium]